MMRKSSLHLFISRVLGKLKKKRHEPLYNQCWLTKKANLYIKPVFLKLGKLGISIPKIPQIARPFNSQNPHPLNSTSQ